MTNNRFEQSIDLKTPIAQVWQAIADHEAFGEWFRVKLEAPFVAGQDATGHITYPGYEHLKWVAHIKEITPEKVFSFTWRPYAIDPTKDYSSETPTLVEFRLEKSSNGTHLQISETGFDKVPAERRDEAYRMQSSGWNEQLKNIEAYLGKK